MDKNKIKIVLAGNPNSGKTSLFNTLTGLNQKVGNYPGVTVDKTTGVSTLDSNHIASIIDLPGIYGMYPKSEDEIVAHEVLVRNKLNEKIDIVVVVADASNLKRNLLLCTQIIDIGYPVVLALSMIDIADKKGIKINTQILSQELNIPVCAINPRANDGIEILKSVLIETYYKNKTINTFINNYKIEQSLNEIKSYLHLPSTYSALLSLNNINNAYLANETEKTWLKEYIKTNKISINSIQGEDILIRYNKIDDILKKAITQTTLEHKKSRTKAIDKWLLHPIWGYVCMLLIMFVVFQSIFWLASYPMDWIDLAFNQLTSWIDSFLPENQWYSSLITKGIIAGIGGIVIFVPQIAILFFFISILEDTGYMSRISFLTDRIMRAVGMNGKSMMPLISGMACAIPAVMATRTIRDPKERLITILVTPLMSCSARLPVYTLLIAMFVPNKNVAGILNLQGLVMMLMYVLGIVAALIVAYVLQFIIKKKNHDFFLMELPIYRAPRWENSIITMFDKAKVFVKDAGKVILLLSIILWFLAAYGPNNTMQNIEERYVAIEKVQQAPLDEEQMSALNNEKLSASYAGILGRTIEPIIAPLGYDWKIGIALISSFAAREVFVATMATLYAVGDVGDDNTPLREKLYAAKRSDGTPVYTLATGMSLMMFYAFAMQCISTIAIVKRETKSWKWTLFQIGYMTGLAYITAWLAYQIFQ
jgi:ferrous iron transport protein B